MSNLKGNIMNNNNNRLKGDLRVVEWVIGIIGLIGLIGVIGVIVWI